MPHREDGGSADASEPLTDAHRKVPSFHRGDVVNYHPGRTDYWSKTFLQDYLLKGWTPAAPFLDRGMKITAFGSCFAANITRHLSNIGYDLSSKRDPDIYVSRLGDGLVNTASILGQFEWALEDKKQPTNLWHGFKAEGFGYDEDIRLRTRAVFLATDFFIITLGLSEIWYDELTGGTFWRAVPEMFFDAARHKFRVHSVAETKADIAAIHRLVRKHVPRAKILFTVSPIPLAATFRPVSCLTANAVSKAIIRAALDEFLRDNAGELNTGLFYFPSMELVQLGFIDPTGPDGRHPTSGILDTVMKTFEAAYCIGDGTLEDANAMFQMFRVQNASDVAKRESSGGEQVRLRQAAKVAERAGIIARRRAKAVQVKLSRIGRLEAKEAQGDGDGDGDANRAELRAARRARREQRRQEEEARPPDD